ncbi:MAG: serine/threonine protein kinase [Kofleriaceae bacterium]|nr:serine/threonine protein kinase [Kofleriaceae bacterium]
MTTPAAKGRILEQTLGSTHPLGHCVACDKSYPLSNRKCPRDGSLLVALSSDTDAMIGRVLDGRFEIKERIGQGGMGTVYRAFQASVSRDVAVIIISANVTPDTIKRFMREARLSSRLAHPNTVIVHDFGQTHDGVIYLVMELIAGQTMTELLEENGPLPAGQFREFAEELCDAIGAAHDAGIVHRDLKPCNIMIMSLSGGRHRLKVLDFGLAKSLNTETSKLSRGNILMGSPSYMAPEIIQNCPADKSSDLYALGCTLHEMASGAPPFDAQSMEALFAQHLQQTPPTVVRTDLGDAPDIIIKLLSKDKKDRPQSVADVRIALSIVQESAQGTTLPDMSLGLGSIGGEFSPPSPTAVASNASTSTNWLPWLLLVAVVLTAGFTIQRLRSSTKVSSSHSKSTTELPQASAANTQGPEATFAATQDASPPLGTSEPQSLTSEIVLVLQSSPKAEVSVDGKVIGHTPITHSQLSSSDTVELRFRRRGYKTQIRTVGINSDSTVDIVLKRKPTVKGKNKPGLGEAGDSPNGDPEPIFR